MDAGQLIAAGKLKDFLAHLGLTLEEYSVTLDKVPQLVEQGMERLLKMPFPLASAYVGHSGGKDSVLVQHLADRVFNVPTLHSTKPTGVENVVHPLTQKFIYEQDRVIIHTPLTRQNEVLSYLGLSTQIDGTRIAEHNRDDGRSIDVVINGKSVSRKELPLYLKDGLLGLDFVYPIYDWSDIEVWTTILKLNIPFSDEYYEL